MVKNSNIEEKLSSSAPKAKGKFKYLNLRYSWYWILLFLICFFIAFFSAGCKKKSDAAPDREVKSVEVANPVTDSVIIYADFPANLVSESQADVVAKVDGNILSSHFTEGSYVSKGQLLYIIDSSNYTPGVKQANAQLESALSQLDYAAKHYAALNEAFEMDAVSQMEVEQAHSAKVQAEAAVKSARSALDAQHTKLGYCRIVAPISGKITSSIKDPGSYVAGDGNPVVLATIYDDSNLTIDFSIPEYQYAQAASLPSGLNSEVYRSFPVELSASADGSGASSVYQAALVYSSPNVEVTSGSIKMKAKILNPGNDLKAGMYGKVKFPINTVSDGILIRDASISTDQRGKYIYTVNDSNKVVYTPVEVGELYRDSLRLIKKGVKPDTRYVTRAMISVRNGETIKPVLIK